MFVQDTIMLACIALKHQQRVGFHEYNPDFISMHACLWHEIKEAHNNKVTKANHPKWVAKNQAMSTNQIKEFFCQVQGIDGAPCVYLMCSTTLTNQSMSNSHALSNH